MAALDLGWQNTEMDSLSAATPKKTKSRIWLKQILLYVLVGVTSNLFGYVLYLSLTELGASPEFAVSILYPVGVAIGFWANRHVTFKHKGNARTATLRYALAHCVGYFLNIGILTVMVNRLGYPHQLVQACAILIVAAYLFLVFRYFVFPISK